MEIISWDLQLEFKLEDLWVGAYWRQTNKRFDLWVCLLPCIPIHLTIERVNPFPQDIKEYTALDLTKKVEGSAL